uniref:Uncharacterized protein n=1 Tax=Arundo donax TaxID=35708 RepID=A0A0A9FW23_ARUDO
MARARPKSPRRALKDASSMMLEALRSRCTTRWSYSSCR